MSCHLHGIYEPCTCPAYLIAMGQNDAVVEADLARHDNNTYMREYARERFGHKPRKEPYEAKRAEFERIIQAGGHGSIAAAAERAGVHRETGRRWPRQMREKARKAA